MGIRHARGDGDRRPRVVRRDVDGLSAGIEPTRVRRWVRAVNPGVVPDAARWAGGLVRRGRPGDPATPHSHLVPPRHQLRQRSGSVRAGQRLSYRPTVRSDCPIASSKRRFSAHDGAALVLDGRSPRPHTAARHVPTTRVKIADKSGNVTHSCRDGRCRYLSVTQSRRSVGNWRKPLHQTRRSVGKGIGWDRCSGDPSGFGTTTP